MEDTPPSLHNTHPKKVLVSTIRERRFSKLGFFFVQQLSTDYKENTHRVRSEQLRCRQLHRSASCASGSLRGTTGKGDGYAIVRDPIIQGRRCRSVHFKCALNWGLFYGCSPQTGPRMIRSSKEQLFSSERHPFAPCSCRDIHYTSDLLILQSTVTLLFLQCHGTLKGLCPVPGGTTERALGLSTSSAQAGRSCWAQFVDTKSW